MSEASRIKERYLASYQKFGVSPQALKYRSKKAQEVRFQNLVSDIDFEGKTILDVGCGFGDVIPFIWKKAKNFKYTGVDIVPEFIDVARRKYPQQKFITTDLKTTFVRTWMKITPSAFARGHQPKADEVTKTMSVSSWKFIVRDYFGKPLNQDFDIVVSSGTLNANIKNALEFRKKAIALMFTHAREVAAFNMAGGHPQPENESGYRVWYSDSLKILEFCLKLTSRVILRHHYRQKDFTLVLFK